MKIFAYEANGKSERNHVNYMKAVWRQSSEDWTRMTGKLKTEETTAKVKHLKNHSRKGPRAKRKNVNEWKEIIKEWIKSKWQRQPVWNVLCVKCWCLAVTDEQLTFEHLNTLSVFFFFFWMVDKWKNRRWKNRYFRPSIGRCVHNFSFHHFISLWLLCLLRFYCFIYQSPQNPSEYEMRLSILLFMLTVYSKHRPRMMKRRKQWIASTAYDNNFYIVCSARGLYTIE